MISLAYSKAKDSIDGRLELQTEDGITCTERRCKPSRIHSQLRAKVHGSGATFPNQPLEKVTSATLFVSRRLSRAIGNGWRIFVDQKLDMPPTSNRGAETPDKNGLRVLVDWFQGTLKNCNSYEKLVHILGYQTEDFTESDRGGNGCTNMAFCGDIQIYYGGKDYVHLRMGGQACRQFEERQNRNWVEITRDLILAGFNWTRLDLAIDDFVGYFTVRRLIRLTETGQCRSRLKGFRSMNSGSIKTGDSKGRTLYLGSPQSMLQIRFYEKLLERLNAGHELEEGIDVWNRTELQFRDQRACDVAQNIAEDSRTLGQIACGILKYYVSFVVKNEDDLQHRERWEVQKFWERYLKGVEPLRLALVAPDRTLVRVYNWIEKQVETSLAVLDEAFGGEPGWLDDLLAAGKNRITEKDRLMIRRDEEKFVEYMQLLKRVREKENKQKRLGLSLERNRKPEVAY